MFGIQPSSGRYAAPGASLRLLEELDVLVEASPAVRQASFADGAPPSGSFNHADELRRRAGPTPPSPT